MSNHAVLVNLPVSHGQAGYEHASALGDRLRERLHGSAVGEYDGSLIGEEWAELYCYGPDADRLWEAVGDIVELASQPAGAYVLKRYGEPGAAEVRIERP